MRPRILVASAALTAVLAAAALPQIAGSATPSRQRPLEASAFQTLEPLEIGDGVGASRQFDAAHRSANSLVVDGRLSEPGAEASTPPGRVRVTTPTPPPGTAPAPPRYSLSGFASWYDNGTTAMRLPAGTTIRICGAGGCVERMVTDWGPSASIRPPRIIDMTPADFSTVCGCGTGTGTTPVRVDVY